MIWISKWLNLKRQVAVTVSLLSKARTWNVMYSHFCRSSEMSMHFKVRPIKIYAACLVCPKQYWRDVCSRLFTENSSCSLNMMKSNSTVMQISKKQQQLDTASMFVQLQGMWTYMEHSKHLKVMHLWRWCAYFHVYVLSSLGIDAIYAIRTRFRVKYSLYLSTFGIKSNAFLLFLLALLFSCC